MKSIPPNRLPYATTKVPWFKTQAEISKLLEKFGINDIIWNTTLGIPELIFKTEVELKEGQPEMLTVIMKVPVFVEKHRQWDPETRSSRIVESPNLSQTGRILKDTLKAKLTYIAGGLEHFEEQFLSDLAIATPEGPKRFVDVLRSRNILTDKGLNVPQLEAKQD